MAHGQSQLFQFLGHARATITAKRLLELIPDMCKDNQILALAYAHGAGPPDPIAARADIHNLTQTVHRDVTPVFFDEGKPRLLLSAKNTVAFFRTSLSYRSIRFSPRLGDLALQIGLDRRFLRIAPFLLYPAVQRRKAAPKICGYLFAR